MVEPLKVKHHSLTGRITLTVMHDAFRAVPVAEIRGNLQAIIDRTKARYPKAEIVIAGMQLPLDGADGYVRAFGEMFTELAEKNRAALIPYLLAGVGGTLLAIAHTSTAGFFTAAVVAGSGFGGSFQGAIRTVVPLAAPHERAGLLSVVYVVSYLAMGVPAVIGGVLVVHGGGVVTTAREYGFAVMALAAVALVGLARRPRPVLI